MKYAIFLCVILSVFAIVRCGDEAERFAEFMQIMAEKAEETNVQFLNDLANTMVKLTSSSEFQKLVDEIFTDFPKVVGDSLMQMASSYDKFVKGAVDGLCELKDNPDATREDVINMLQEIKTD